MTEATRHRDRKTTAIAKIRELFERFGAEAYGEGCDQRSHAIQSARAAKRRNLDDELIVSAFLHDIGHLCVKHEDMQQSHEKMGQFGVMRHDKWGAKFLRDYGFPDRVVAPVENHVEAKRYLCATDSSYLGKLSQASIETLSYQGGAMSATQQEKFKLRPFFEESILIRLTDDEGKDENHEEAEGELENLLELSKKVIR